MARTIKRGLDYFPFDVDFFQDIRIRKLIKYQGGKAVTVYALLLCTIYKNGYYAEWDKELPFIISEQSGYTEAYIQEVIDCCLNIGLLSKELFESDKVLTSKGIQERYRRICSSSRRNSVIAEYNLIPAEEKTENSQSPQKSTEKSPQQQKPKVAKPKPKPIQPPTVEQSVPATPVPTALTAQKYSLSIDDEVTEMKKSAQWKESVCIRYQLSNEQVDAYLADFALKCDKQHTSLQDAKSHFCYWLQKQKKDESQPSARGGHSPQTKPPANDEYQFNGGFGGVDI
ncbi:DUF4373 domain-containing protein [uncultured Duncaniella sp.]|uniref:DUF4373 domain-containing protein n=1 Tax=uncultured Duncaniella sp. TaxID=2768039 RepID=UPI00273048E4|nr:DUF4373 domain-containing protein [uncultured Duncaniella sp.]